MSDDIDEFVSVTQTYKASNKVSLQDASYPVATKDKDAEKVPGKLTQYSYYRDGYMATTDTLPTLPSACYDVTADQNGVFVTPMPSPAGLLLELPEMRSDEVIKIAENFWNSENDYKYGNEFVTGKASFKAGIMLYGPPGSGKSCTIKIISKKIVQRGGVVFFCSVNPNFLHTTLLNLSNIEKDRKCVVVLEDLDSLIDRFGEAGYLDILDSAKSIENVLFIATTNYPERLDPRIYNRPGRFSHVIKVGLPGAKARDAFLRCILKNHRDVDAIVEKTEGFSIDHLSALVNSVYREKKTLNLELDRLRRLFKIPKTEDKSIGF